MLETIYGQCLAHEMTLKGIAFAAQVPIPVRYKEVLLEGGFRVDFLVENTLLLELKSVERFESVHDAQILTYMKFARVKSGLLINFNVKRLKDGIKRFIL